MSKFSFFASKQLVPEWSYSADGLIWRMIATDMDTIVGESRDPERRTASFFCLETVTGAPRWSDLKLSEPWWIGIEAVQRSVLLLHSFVSPDMPQHKGIWAFDATTGEELWQKGEYTFWFCVDDRVIAFRDLFEKRVGYELDLQTGTVLKTHDASLAELQTLRQGGSSVEPGPQCVLPEPLGDQAGARVQEIVRKETKGKDLAAPVEYVEREGFSLFNYHVRIPAPSDSIPRLENHLAIYDLATGRRLYAEVIGTNLVGYVPDSFFIMGPRALFIKDQKHLKAIRLWKS